MTDSYDDFHISEENIKNIIFVFLAGSKKTTHPPECGDLIQDGYPYPHRTWCRWNEVFKLRDTIVNNLLNSDKTKELGLALQNIHREED